MIVKLSYLNFMFNTQFWAVIYFFVKFYFKIDFDETM